MNLWRTFHREVVTACRSLRYDLRRWLRGLRPGQRARTGRAGATVVIPVVDAGRAAADETGAAYAAYTRRRPRRVHAALAVAVLAAGGAAATYFGVVGGLSALIADEPAAPGALPQVDAGPSPTPPSPLPTAPAPTTGLGYPDLPATDPADPLATTPPAATPADRPAPNRPSRRPGQNPEQTVPIPSPAPDPTPTCSCPKPSPTTSPSTSPTPTTSPPPTDPPCDHSASGPAGPPETCDPAPPGPGNQAQPWSGS